MPSSGGQEAKIKIFLTPEEGTDRCPETSARNYYHSLRNNPRRAQFSQTCEICGSHSGDLRVLFNEAVNCFANTALVK